MKKDPTQFRERFKRWKEGEQVYEAGLPKYEDGTFPDSFYKNLYNDKWNNSTPDVDFYQEAFDYSEKEALVCQNPNLLLHEDPRHGCRLIPRDEIDG